MDSSQQHVVVGHCNLWVGVELNIHCNMYACCMTSVLHGVCICSKARVYHQCGKRARLLLLFCLKTLCTRLTKSLQAVDTSCHHLLVVCHCRCATVTHQAICAIKGSQVREGSGSQEQLWLQGLSFLSGFVMFGCFVTYKPSHSTMSSFCCCLGAWNAYSELLLVNRQQARLFCWASCAAFCMSTCVFIL